MPSKAKQLFEQKRARYGHVCNFEAIERSLYNKPDYLRCIWQSKAGDMQM